MFIIDDNNQPQKIEETTFLTLGKKESDIEEILRKIIDMLCDDEESMLIVGQQVRNEQNGRSDLTAVDHNGDIVLIEIKRDKKDIEHRKEAFEFQAIRYAASCAMIDSESTLIQDVFGPYIEKHKHEYQDGQHLTSTELAKRMLSNFFAQNGTKEFNKHQRIILVASDFDEQTLSAVAWLNSNQVDISCFQICPYEFMGHVLIDMKKILPVPDYEDFYVSIVSKNTLTKNRKKDISRRSLPKIDALMSWGIVSPGDILVAKGTTQEAVLQKNGQVKFGVEPPTSIQKWLKRVFGWASVETYAFSLDKKTGKTLSSLRQEYIERT